MRPTPTATAPTTSKSYQTSHWHAGGWPKGALRKEGALFVGQKLKGMTSRTPGKARVILPYLGGFRAYKRTCDAVAAGGYEGFAIA